MFMEIMSWLFSHYDSKIMELEFSPCIQYYFTDSTSIKNKFDHSWAKYEILKILF